MRDDALDALFADFSIIEKENYRSVYRAVDEMLDSYMLYALPLYEGASEIQSDFESNVKAVLKSARGQYIKRINEGEAPDTVLAALAESSLAELKSLSGR